MGAKKRHDRIVVVDIECTCWEDDDEPQGEQPSEIIEIGACLIDFKESDSEKMVKQKTSYLIRPRKSTVSKFCTRLTGITPEMLKQQGIPFEHAINKLRKEFGTGNKVWMSWGDGDKHKIRSECELTGATYPFGYSHINLRPLFTFFEELDKAPGLEKAVKSRGMVFQGQQHRAHDDAYMTAWVFLTLIGQYRGGTLYKAMLLDEF